MEQPVPTPNFNLLLDFLHRVVTLADPPSIAKRNDGVFVVTISSIQAFVSLHDVRVSFIPRNVINKSVTMNIARCLEGLNEKTMVVIVVLCTPYAQGTIMLPAVLLNRLDGMETRPELVIYSGVTTSVHDNSIFNEEAPHRCEYCKKIVAKTYLCSACKCFRFCGTDCQTQAWDNGHKLVCNQYLTIVKLVKRELREHFKSLKRSGIPPSKRNMKPTPSRRNRRGNRSHKGYVVASGRRIRPRKK